jgi:DNA polymerase-3 subunit delta
MRACVRVTEVWSRRGRAARFASLASERCRFRTSPVSRVATRRSNTLAGMSELSPAYLIHGDDEVKLDAWRARVRERASREAASLEVLAGERASGEAVAAALASLTLSMGRRYVLADGVERWKERDVAAAAAALRALPPDTVVVLIASGKVSKGSGPAPAKLVKAVETAGGEVKTCAAPTVTRLPAWVAERAAELGLAVDPDAAQALVDRVGADQRRLLRELEKIACYAPERGRVDVDVIEELTVSDVEAKAYELADAVIGGDGARAMSLAEDLETRGADIMHIIFAMLRRARDTRRAWAVLESGGSARDLQSALRMQPWMAKRIAAQARSADGERLERIAAQLADLDFAVRGGGKIDTGTALTLTLART